MPKELNTPILADVICKVNRNQTLLPSEELVYFQYVEKIVDEEVRWQILRDYKEGKQKH